MFEKVGRLAEAAATKVSLSRRGFLGRLGRGALALTGVLGGLLAIPTDARAETSLQNCIMRCCEATCGKGNKTCSCDPTGFAYLNCFGGCRDRGF
jgi:hypothetical protein